MAKQIITGEYAPVKIDTSTTNTMRAIDKQIPADDHVVFNFKHYEKISNCLRSTKFLIEQLDLCLDKSVFTNGELHEHVKSRSDDST